MLEDNLHLLETAPLPYLLSLPGGEVPEAGAWPVLCFLHGYEEGPPTGARNGLTRHGPLRADASAFARSRFIILAPHLPSRGDIWDRHADDVQTIVRRVQGLYRGIPQQTYLTGFSFGASGVFDLALRSRDFWAALWAVDPTRVPPEDPGRPVWLSSGEISRHSGSAFVQRLGLRPLDGHTPGARIYEDQGQDHVGTATLAYQNDAIYKWLLTNRL